MTWTANRVSPRRRTSRVINIKNVVYCSADPSVFVRKSPGKLVVTSPHVCGRRSIENRRVTEFFL